MSECVCERVVGGFLKRQSTGPPPELRQGEEAGPGINGLLIDSSYIIFFSSRAHKSLAPCKNRI